MQEPCRGWRTKWFDGGPELGVRQQTFFRKLLVQSRVSEADSEYVTKVAECDESGQATSSSAVAEDIAEDKVCVVRKAEDRDTRQDGEDPYM